MSERVNEHDFDSVIDDFDSTEPTPAFETASYMQNRELSWLKFNERVLLEANRADMPLMERFKFISIFTSNLDEFFMIRVGSLSDSVLLDNMLSDNKTGMSAMEQLDEIYRALPPLYELVGQAFFSVTQGLQKHGIEFVRIEDLSASELKTLKSHFMHNIMPFLSPSIIDTKHPFPHIHNMQMHIAVTLEKKRGTTFGLIAVPSELERLILLDGKGWRFVLLEELILYFADLTFGTYSIIEGCVIAVTRNADVGTDEEQLDEGIDFRQHMKALLKKRQRLAPVRLELTRSISPEMVNFLCSRLHLGPQQVFLSSAPLDLSFSFNWGWYFDKNILNRLVWPTHMPANPLPASVRGDMIKLISEKDLLLSFPYESMLPFISLIRQATDNPSVLSIKITVYRLDAQSKLAEYLIQAAENGKEVIVLMELRARFDESNNIEWASRFEEAGCRVIYGLVGYKCHSKLCLITQRKSGKLHYITQIGTGNFNEKTAKLYTDLSLITANQEIGHDAAAFFSNMLIGNLEGEYTHLWVAPNSFKNNVMASIERERQKALTGMTGKIVIKCNSLTDRDIIEKLVEASADGVNIFMNVRGICCLVPELSGVTDNISIFSIVGKFLEHTRIFCFGEGADADIYISSADFMTRNTERRVEVACPILDVDLKNRIIWMLDTMFNDDTNAWDLRSDGNYVLRECVDPTHPRNSQEHFTIEAKSRAIQTEEDDLLLKQDDSKPSSKHILKKSMNRLLKRK
ncbi:MAG: polyphosphate kinase 1 [Oscillospiraceae bacterium]|nr:polyphosphate kinase 1 [Oscillospiraceae bacterium]